MVWLYRSPIPVGRMGIFSYLFKWFLPAFTVPTAYRKGRGGVSTLCAKHLKWRDLPWEAPPFPPCSPWVSRSRGPWPSWMPPAGSSCPPPLPEPPSAGWPPTRKGTVSREEFFLLLLIPVQAGWLVSLHFPFAPYWQLISGLWLSVRIFIPKVGG